jgi:hypothetical protein
MSSRTETSQTEFSGRARLVPPSRLRPAAVGGLVLAAVALTGAAGTIDSEHMLARAFDRAFAAKPVTAAAPAKRAYDGIAGSEEFWLRAEGNVSLLTAVAVGQQLTLTANGSERHMTITDVRRADEDTTHIDTSPPGRAVLFVTCREGEAGQAREIRLRLESDQMTTSPAAEPPGPHVL